LAEPGLQLSDGAELPALRGFQASRDASGRMPEKLGEDKISGQFF
jgi:hypothetical protein